MPEEVTTNAETVSAFLNVLCVPLSRAIVDELQHRGLTMLAAPAKVSIQQFQANADQGDYEAMERQYVAALARCTELQKQLAAANSQRVTAEQALGRAEARIEMLEAQLADVKVKPGQYVIGIDPGAPEGDRTVKVAIPDKSIERQKFGGLSLPETYSVHDASRDKTRADAMDEAMDFEDDPDIPEPVPEPPGTKRAGISQVKATCETCLWWSGKVCQRQGCQWVNHHRGAATPACEKYVYTKHARNRLPVPDGPDKSLVGKMGTHKALVGPKAEPLKAEPERRKRNVRPDDHRKGPRPRAVCPACHTEHCVTSRGIYPHDIHGIDYRRGRGDRSRPCPGKKAKASA